MRLLSSLRFHALAASVFFLCLVCPLRAQDITTWQGDLMHTGNNTNEATLTPKVVQATGNFGLLFTQQMDGEVFGQPLFLSAATLNALPGSLPDGKSHNVVYVATEAGTVFAFDADADPQGTNPNGTNSSPLWSTSLIPSGSAPITQKDVASGDILGDLALTETPVIDSATGTLYVIATIKNPNVSPQFQQLLYALDVKTGQNKVSASPTIVTASFPGTYVPPSSSDKDPVTSSNPGLIPFSPLHEHLRGSMALYTDPNTGKKTIFCIYASHSDESPYYGEILGFDATTLQVVKQFNDLPNSTAGAGGLWQSGAGPAMDAAGNLFVMTGNGDFDQNKSNYTTATDWGESALRVSTAGTAQQMVVPYSDTTGWFTPYNWVALNQGGNGAAPDRDLGAGGLLLLPDQTAGSHTKIMVGGGKAGVLYVLDQQSLGGMGNNDPSAIQEIIEPNAQSLFVTPSYFNNNIYYAPAGGHMEQRAVGYDSMTGGYISPTAIASTSTSDVFGSKGSGAFISASSPTQNGIVWAVNNALVAYDATNVSTAIYNVATSVPGTNGTQCTTAKFTVPIATNGKVYFTCFNGNTQIGYLFVEGVFPVQAGVPTAPSLTTVMPYSASEMKISWQNNTTNQSSVAVRRSTSSTSGFSTIATVSGTVTGYNDTQLNPGTTYYYQLQAINSNGPSQYSNVLPGTTLPTYTTPGLVMYLTFDEQSGSVIHDVSGNGHNGAVSGEDLPSPNGYVNSDWIFHGTGATDRIVVPNAAALQFSATQSFTLSSWFTTSKLAGVEQSLVCKSADQGNRYGIWINANNQWVGRGPSGDLVGPTAQVDTWTHVALVQDGAANKRYLYINGALAASGPAQAADGAGDLWIGQQNSSAGDEGYQGQIDELRLYNYALAPSAVGDLLPPPVVSAMSNLTQGSAGVLGVQLLPGTFVATEPRSGANAGAYSVQLQFAAPVQGISASLGVQAGSAQQAAGQTGTVSYDSTDTIVTIPLTGVSNNQALNLHLTGIVPVPVQGNGVTAIAGTADVPFDVLVGDVSGDHVVDKYDAAAVQANVGANVNSTNNFFDVNGDGVIDTNDVNAVTSHESSKWALATDTTLAVYKTATASTVNQSNAANGAFDNNLSTRWESVQGSSADPSTLYVDLGATAVIHSISINWENAAGATYLLQVNNDPTPPTSSTQWTTVATETKNTGGGIRTYGGLNAVGRYVQMYGETRTGPYGYSILEMPVVGYFPGSSAGAAAMLAFTNPPATPIASGGNAGTVTVAVEDASGNVETSDSGTTVTLAVTGPGSYSQTYTATDANGAASFSLGGNALTGAGTYTYSATSGSLTSASSTESVTASSGAAASLTMTGLATFTAPGLTGSAVVKAVDASGNTATSFTGTVTLTSTDATATLPASYTFTSADAGTHSFSVTLNTAGTYTVSATSGSLAGSQSGILVQDAIWILNANSTAAKVTSAGVASASSGAGSGTAAHGGVAFDGSGNAWMVTNTSNSVQEFTKTGGTINVAGSSAAGVNTPAGLAVDGAGSVWIVNGNDTVSQLSNAGAAVSGSSAYSPYGAAINGATAIAIDNAGGVWIANGSGNSVTHILGAAAPVVAPTATAVSGASLGGASMRPPSLLRTHSSGRLPARAIARGALALTLLGFGTGPRLCAQQPAAAQVQSGASLNPQAYIDYLIAFKLADDGSRPEALRRLGDSLRLQPANNPAGRSPLRTVVGATDAQPADAPWAHGPDQLRRLQRGRTAARDGFGRPHGQALEPEDRRAPDRAAAAPGGRSSCAAFSPDGKRPRHRVSRRKGRACGTPRRASRSGRGHGRYGQSPHGHLLARRQAGWRRRHGMKAGARTWDGLTG